MESEVTPSVRIQLEKIKVRNQKSAKRKLGMNWQQVDVGGRERQGSLKSRCELDTKS